MAEAQFRSFLVRKSQAGAVASLERRRGRGDTRQSQRHLAMDGVVGRTARLRHVPAPSDCSCHDIPQLKRSKVSHARRQVHVNRGGAGPAYMLMLMLTEHAGNICCCGNVTHPAAGVPLGIICDGKLPTVVGSCIWELAYPLFFLMQFFVSVSEPTASRVRLRSESINGKRTFPQIFPIIRFILNTVVT